MTTPANRDATLRAATLAALRAYDAEVTAGISAANMIARVNTPETQRVAQETKDATRAAATARMHAAIRAAVQTWIAAGGGT